MDAETKPNSPPPPAGPPLFPSLLWTVPVMMIVYAALGLFIGRKLGSEKWGVLCGLLVGMVAVFYEVWKLQRRP